MHIRPALLHAACGLLLFATSARAQTSALEGTVTDANGRPLGGAEVRLEQEKAKNRVSVVKTDARGHFVAKGLPVATFKVSASSGATKLGGVRVATKKNQILLINLGRQTAPATFAAAGTKKKRSIWVPAQTGSHMGGHFEDVGDSDTAQRGTGNMDGMSDEALRRIQYSPQVVPAAGGR